MLRWLPTLWLGFVIVRYSRTSFRTLLAPYNPGSDVEWAIAWMAFALAVVLSAVFLKRSFVNRMWFGLIGGMAVAILALSHTVLPALAALAVFAVSAGLGEFVLQRFRLDPTPLIERLVLTVPIGIGFVALSLLALASLGFFNVMTCWALILALALPGLSGVRSLLKFKVENGLAGHSPGIILCAYVFLLNLTWATAPEIQYDAVNVHLAVPKLYLQSGGLIDLPYFWNSYMAHLLSMLYGLCLALAGMLAAKFLVMGLGVLAAGGVYVLGRRLFNDEVGVWASLLFYSTPLVIWSSTTMYLDLPQALFVTGSAVAFLRWYEKPQWAWMAVSGWIGGVAVGNKVAAVATMIVFPIITLSLACRQMFHRPGSDRSYADFRAIAAYALLLLVVALPWHLLVYEYTGNPFFPLLNKVFHSPAWPAENTSLDWNTFGMGTSLGSLLRIPFRLTLDSSRFGTARGAVGFALLLAFPLALGYVWSGTLPQRAILAAIGVHFTVWAFTAQYARYYIPVLPFVAVVGSAALIVRQSGPVLLCNRVLLLAGVLAQTPVASVLFWNIPERFPVDRALGLETQESFLTRGISGYGSARFLNTVWKPGEKILGVGMEQLRFYFDGPLYTQHHLYLTNFETPADLRDALAKDGFAYIVASRTALGNPEPWFGYLQPQFLERFGKRLYGDEATAVFSIRDP
jgi:hypothetical protein